MCVESPLIYIVSKHLNIIFYFMCTFNIILFHTVFNMICTKIQFVRFLGSTLPPYHPPPPPSPGRHNPIPPPPSSPPTDLCTFWSLAFINCILWRGKKIISNMFNSYLFPGITVLFTCLYFNHCRVKTMDSLIFVSATFITSYSLIFVFLYESRTDTDTWSHLIY